MADAYRKVGRGGAGNFYSPKDVEEATKAPSNDLEAQKPAPADELPSDPAEAPRNQPPAGASATPAYARTGRGGAGNFVDPLAASSSSTRPHSHSQQPRPATVHSTGNQSFAQPSGPADPAAPSSTGAQRAPPRAGLTGRGGAGNWASTEDQKTVDEEQERKRKEAIDKGVFDDVRAGLKEPGRAHTRVHPHGRGGGPRGLEES
ncbi:hypothetical protein SCAR479_12203 [Seiridium cardinale]|uniref:Uncharacterized protein n=1 Tax=Seiridium cardinale TaxID=138064 RepID=A0ABR2XBC7_9PEZI